MATTKKSTTNKTATKAKSKAKSTAKKEATNKLSEATGMSKSTSRKVVTVTDKVSKKIHPVTLFLMFLFLIIGGAAGYFIAAKFIFKTLLVLGGTF